MGDLEFLDKKIFNEIKEDIEDSVFSDEFGECIDSLANLETDKDIFDRCCCDDLGGKENE